jgi:RNA polymerase sigma-70 factor, ECF subfamily
MKMKESKMEKALAINERTTDFHPRVAAPRSENRDVLDDDAPEDLVVERLQAGDTRAFDIIFNRYANRVYRQAVKLVGNEADAEEIVQDAFMLVYEKAKNFRGESAFSSWLYRVTLNAALSKIRRHKKDETVDIDEYLPRFAADGHHLVRPVVDWSKALDQRLIDGELQSIVRKAMDQLGAVDKAILVSDLDGYSNREIADALNLTVQAVKARLHRARLFLRGKLAVELGYSAA